MKKRIISATLIILTVLITLSSCAKSVTDQFSKDIINGKIEGAENSRLTSESTTGILKESGYVYDKFEIFARSGEEIFEISSERHTFEDDNNCTCDKEHEYGIEKHLKINSIWHYEDKGSRGKYISSTFSYRKSFGCYNTPSTDRRNAKGYLEITDPDILINAIGSEKSGEELFEALEGKLILTQDTDQVKVTEEVAITDENKADVIVLLEGIFSDLTRLFSTAESHGYDLRAEK